MIPELRFPEFEGEWEKKRLGKIANLTSSKRVYLSDYVDEGIPFYRGKEITELRQNIQPENILYISQGRFNEFKKKYGAPKKGDILITAIGTLGNVYRIKINYDFYFKDGNLIWLRNVNENSIFLEQLIDWKKHELIKVSIESTQKALTIVELNKVKFVIPTLPEQTRIAIFLTAVDKRIKLLQKKKAELEQYKKGVMQKLFSQELRFKIKNKAGELVEPPDWEEKMLGDLYSFKTTNSFSRDKLNYESGSVKNIHYGDIHTKFNSHFNIEKENIPFVNTEVDIKRIASDCFLQEGDLVVADASEDYADIGKTIEVVNLNNEKVLAGLHTFLARRKSKEITIGFMGHLMKAYYMRLDIMRIAQGTKVLGISTKRLAEIKIALPSPLVQQKIASFLSSIDKKVEKTAQQIVAAQQWKQGLLQKMFV